VPFCAIHGAKHEACPIAGTDFLEYSYHDLLGDPAAVKTMDLMIQLMNDRVRKMTKIKEQL
jgi:hypothetical protein